MIFLIKLNEYMGPPDPYVFKYTIRVSGENHEDPVPTCYDLHLDKPEPYIPTNHGGQPAFPQEEEIRIQEEKIDNLITQIHRSNSRREFLMAFAESPIDVINLLVSQQIKEIKETKNQENIETELDPRSDTYHQEWYADAVDHYLDIIQRKQQQQQFTYSSTTEEYHFNYT